jgi:hypothetical protein
MAVNQNGGPVSVVDSLGVNHGVSPGFVDAGNRKSRPAQSSYQPFGRLAHVGSMRGQRRHAGYPQELNQVFERVGQRLVNRVKH